jgi:hypothetical protein
MEFTASLDDFPGVSLLSQKVLEAGRDLATTRSVLAVSESRESIDKSRWHGFVKAQMAANDVYETSFVQRGDGKVESFICTCRFRRGIFWKSYHKL